MVMPLYDAFVPWYPLLDPLEDHEDEARAFDAAIRSVLGPTSEKPSLLELGSGAGHNAAFLQDYELTLTDLSPGMLDMSRRTNRDATHRVADMRTARWNETFDAVLVHDAITYMTTEADLRAAMTTAFVHTRPGGAAVFAPDYYLDTFEAGHEFYKAANETHALAGVEWVWRRDDPHRYRVTYSFALEDADGVRPFVDEHAEGLFTRDQWKTWLEAVGFDVSTWRRPISEDEEDEVFLCQKPLEGPKPGS